MKKFFFNKRLGSVITLVSSVALASSAVNADEPQDTGKIVVANRTSGTISVIDVATDKVVKTITVAVPGARPPEPMYVNYVPALRRIFVSDRSNKYVAVYDDKNFNMIDTAPLGRGAFHMWTDPKGKQLWSVNDVDKTLSVINPRNLRTLGTLNLPKDLVDAGGKPHDIALDSGGTAAFVTVIGAKKVDTSDSDSDGDTQELVQTGYVLRYSTRSRAVTHRAEVGVDPHVGLAYKKPLLYVACQGSVPQNAPTGLYILNSKNLAPLRAPLTHDDDVALSSVHGTGMKHSDRTFYTTNITGGGTQGLVAIDVATQTVMGRVDTGGEDVPHNIAITGKDTKLYVTHSGHGEGEVKGVVTVYDIRDDTAPTFLRKINVGLNPFGIAYVPGSR